MGTRAPIVKYLIIDSQSLGKTILSKSKKPTDADPRAGVTYIVREDVRNSVRQGSEPARFGKGSGSSYKCGTAPASEIKKGWLHLQKL